MDGKCIRIALKLEIGCESTCYLLKRIRKAMGQQDSDYLLSVLMAMPDAAGS